MLSALVGDALHAIALSGKQGVLLVELFPLLLRCRDDEHIQAFVWKQLRMHPQVALSADDGNSRPTTLKKLELADAQQVRLTASEALRAWTMGVRESEEDDGLPKFPSADVQKVLEVTAAVLRRGIMQNEAHESGRHPRK